VTAPDGGLGSGVRGIGVDAVDVARFRQLLERRPALVDRLFTASEQEYARRSRDPGPRLAVRFAAKEAVLKALGVGIGAAAFRDVEVGRGPEGEPRVRLSGPLEARIEQAMARYGLTREQARRQERENDGARAAWVQRFYGRNVTDPSLYDLVFNATRFGVHQCVELIATAARAA